VFRDSRSEVEQLIDEAFREKVQAFLDNCTLFFKNFWNN